MFYQKKQSFDEWQIPVPDGQEQSDGKVYVAFDCEYQSGVTSTIPIGDRSQEVSQRRLEDIISLQVAFNYMNVKPVKYFIHREPTDNPFIFNDIVKPMKEYLRDIGVYGNLKKSHKAFTIELWLFFGGVDISSLADSEKILTEYAKDDKTGKIVAIHGNTVFTSRPLKLIVKDWQRHTVKMPPKPRLVMRDMTKLAPAKFNLAKLGEMVAVPKLDTEKWDKADQKIPGYYKSHMSELWQNRRDDFIAYSMTDTVITALYGSYMLAFEVGLMTEDLGSFKPGILKPSLGSIVANVVAQKNDQPADWIIDQVYDDLKEISGTRKDYECYLKPICRIQDKSKGKILDYGFTDLFKTGGGSKNTKQWLTKHLDFDLVRKGYYFPHADSTDDPHHKHLVNDFENRRDTAHAKLFFEYATDAFYGGYNVAHVPGIIPKGGIKQDYDLKSAYNTAGHLIPDVAPALGGMGTKWKDVPTGLFQRIVDEASSINGAYTIGVGVFDIEYPDSYVGFTITPKVIDEGPHYMTKQQNVTLSYTDAYTAWLSGAHVYTHHLEFVVQGRMDVKARSEVCQEGLVQDVFQQRRNKYPDKHNPLNILNKNAGNQVFGITGEGLKKKRSRDFGDGKGYYIPFSQATNPLKAMQFTAITRLHIVLLQRAIKRIDNSAIFLNNVTDGCLVWTKFKLDHGALINSMKQVVSRRYQDVVETYFDGQYFEEKDSSMGEVANLRTRLTFSRDSALHAMVGINSLTPDEVFVQYLDQNQIKIPVQNRVISGITDMRHTKKFQHLQTSWDEPSDLFLGYDFAQWPIKYQSDSRFVYWETRPYHDEGEFNDLQLLGRTLIKYAPFYDASFADAFSQTLIEFKQGGRSKYFGEFVKKADSKTPPMKANEVYFNWALYVARNGFDIVQSYRKFTNLIDQEGWPFYRGGKEVPVPAFATFKAFIKRHTNGNNGSINHVLLCVVGLI